MWFMAKSAVHLLTGQSVNQMHHFEGMVLQNLEKIITQSLEMVHTILKKCKGLQ